jgi:hypothetical protein
MTALLDEGWEPDQFTLDLLNGEHEQFKWIGPRLLGIANRVRGTGGSKDDFSRWVKASQLWRSYQGSTSDSVTAQGRNLESAWQKARNHQDFTLEEALDELAYRVATAAWTGRSGSRDRTVALAFISFCAERNCFTRTISSYELSKYTPGISPVTVGRALIALVKIGLLTKVDRTDRRTSARSTRRYQINLYWKPKKHRGGASKPESIRSSVGEARSTRKYTLIHLQKNTVQDVFSHRGLGLTTGRVWAVLGDEAMSVKDIAAAAGVSTGQAYTACRKLADNCLAGVKPGIPVLYFRVDTPLEVVAEMLGCDGYIDRRIAATELRQEANRAAFPFTYQSASPPPF